MFGHGGSGAGLIMCGLIVRRTESRLPVRLSDRQHMGGLSKSTPFLRNS